MREECWVRTRIAYLEQTGRREQAKQEGLYELAARSGVKLPPLDERLRQQAAFAEPFRRPPRRRKRRT